MKRNQKEKSFLLLGTTSKRHLLNSGNKQQLQCSMSVPAFAPSSLQFLQNSWVIFRGEVTQINLSNQDPQQFKRVFPAHTLTRLIAGKCLVLNMFLFDFYSKGKKFLIFQDRVVTGQFYVSTINYTFTSCCIPWDITMYLWLLIHKHL